MSDYIIRPYNISDRHEVRRIAADNGFFGQPVENIMNDRNFFNDVLMDVYLKTDEAIGFVAVFDGHVMAYIVGVADTKKFRTKKLRFLFYAFMKSFLLRYKTGKKTYSYLYNRLMSKLRDESSKTDLTEYPAHLHIDTDISVRGKGVGTALMKTFMDKLKTEGASGVHLSTTNFNTAAVGMYEKLGFTVEEDRKSTEYGKSPEFSELKKLIMVKKL